MKFDGLEAIELKTAKVRMVVVTEIGPRIAFLGKVDSDENLLYWDKEGVNRNGWKLCGGHRVWMTRPGADESEDTYALDNETCKVEMLEDGVMVTGKTSDFAKIERGMEIHVVDDETFEVINFVKNTGELIYSGGVWSPTCINPDNKEIRIPLGEDNTTWDLVTIVIPRVFAGNTVRIDDPQVTYEGNDMVVKSQGKVCKRCVKAPKGVISMYCPVQEVTFTKKVKYVEDGAYPLGGCNLAVFIGEDNWMGELESFGVEKSIKPNETIYNHEQWSLK